MNFKTRNSAAFVLAAGSFLTGQAKAEEAFDLGTVVLTATGQEQSLADVQASVQVIDAQTIRTSGASSVTRLLKDAVGIDARSSGTNGSITIRGQKSSGTLILIDGQPRTGKYGNFSLDNFPMEEVERIEIVRGPMSALYGADALGGVINVITRRPGSNPGKTVSTLLGTRPDDGERTTFRLGTAVEFGDETLGQRLAVDLHKAGGYALPATTRGQDFSAIDRVSLAWSGSWMPSDGQELRWRVEAYRQDDERDTFTTRTNLPYTALEQEKRISADLSWAQDLGQGRLTVTGLLSYSDGMANRGFPIEEVTLNRKARLQARYDLGIGDHNLSFAAGAEHENISINTYSSEHKENQFFALIQDEWMINDRVAMTFGARIDRFESFGTTINPRVTIGSRGDGFTWRIGGGSAFRAPDMSERYANIIRGPGVIIGNPDLDPETSVSFEAVVGWRDTSRSVELVYHDSRVEDMITTRSTNRVINGYRVTEYLNVDEARIKGLELTGNWDATDQLSLSGALEYLDARDAITNDRLTGRHRSAYRLSATYSVGDWLFTGRLRGLQGFWDADNDVSTTNFYNSSFTTVDLNALYALGDDSEIGFGIDNVFDEKFDPNYSSARFRDDGGRFAYINFKRRF